MLLAALLGFTLTIVSSLPADWAWRRGNQMLIGVTTAFSVAAIIGSVSLIGRLGLLSGFASIVALALAVWLGGYLGNVVATRIWGPARFWA